MMRHHAGIEASACACLLGYWTTHGYANSRTANSRLSDSRTGHLADRSTPGLDNSRTGQLADAISDFACLVMAALRSRCGHYIFAPCFLSSIFFLFLA